MAGSSKCDVQIELSESTNEAILSTQGYLENLRDCSAKVTARNATAANTTDNSSNGTVSRTCVKQTEQSTVRAALLSVLTVTSSVGPTTSTYEIQSFIDGLQVSRLQMKLSECIAPFPFLCSCRKFQAVTLSLFPYRAYSLTVSKLLVVPSAITTHWGAETHCQPVYHVVADKATTVKKGFRARVTSHDAGMHGLIYWFDGKILTTRYFEVLYIVVRTSIRTCSVLPVSAELRLQ